MKKTYSVLMTLMIMDIGGAETHVLELSKALAKTGIKVYVASNGGVYVKELEDSGIKHFKLPLHTKNPASLIKSYKGLEKIIRENDISLVHAHARIPAFLCGKLHKRLKFHFVTSAHQTFNTIFPLNILTNWGEYSIAVSDDIKRYLIKSYRIHKDRIAVTVNGIDTEKFDGKTDFSSIVQELKLDSNKKKIVSVSRLDKNSDYGAHLLLEAAEDIYSNNKNIEIIIVGAGDDYENIKRKANAINSKLKTKLIYLTGARTDIDKFLALCTFFVGVSRSALEAMAAKKPVILVGNQGYYGIYNEAKEKVSIGTNFCFRDMKLATSKDIARDCIELLSKDQHELDILGKAGKKTVQNHYSVQRMAMDTKAVYETALRRKLKKVDVVVSGYYGSRNSGDDALLQSITDAFKANKKSVVVLSRRPSETKEVFGVKSIFWLNIFSIIKTMKDAKLLVMGGGNLMQDGTSTRNLYYYLSIIRLAKHYGAKVMLYSNGIGPINKEKNKKLAHKNLNSFVDCITLREEKSLEELKKIGVTKPPVTVTADAAFSLKSTKTKKPLYTGDYFVVSLRGWKKLDSSFEEKIAHISDYIKEKYKLQAVFISMQDVTDVAISKRVCIKMTQGGVMLDQKYNLEETISIIENAKFILGMRLHTLIYAAKSGIPVIGLVYDPKVKAMMEYIGQQFFTNVDAIESDKVISYVDHIMDNYDKISQELVEVSHKLRKKEKINIEKALELIKR